MNLDLVKSIITVSEFLNNLCSYFIFQVATEALSKICIELENNRVSRK